MTISSLNTFRTVTDNNVVFSIPPTSPCPCGSNNIASQCCLTASGLHKISARTKPPIPQTKYINQKCYANKLSDCSPKISKEHYISESLLHHLNQANNLRASGLPWLKDEERVIPPSALTSKVLCERHNFNLSTLEVTAVRLFQAFDESRTTENKQQLLYLFSGHDLERWLLKILCGLAYSKNISLDIDTDITIPKSWLEILFGDAEFPEEQGLYLCIERGHRLEGPHGLKLQTITGKGRLSGVGLWICGYELILSMNGFPSRSFDGRKVVYRPLELYATGKDYEKSIVFSWDRKADLGTIHLEIGQT